MDTKIIKEIVNSLPVTGDKLTRIENEYAIYSSGGRIKIDSSTRLKVGDTVTGVYHGHETSSGKTKIYVNVDHLICQNAYSDNYYEEYLKIKRDFLINDLINNGNN